MTIKTWHEQSGEIPNMLEMWAMYQQGIRRVLVAGNGTTHMGADYRLEAVQDELIVTGRITLVQPADFLKINILVPSEDGDGRDDIQL